jgi:hypothetical protein
MRCPRRVSGNVVARDRKRSSFFGFYVLVFIERKMMPFNLTSVRLKFREPPPQAFYHRAWRRRCNAASVRHQSIRGMPPDRPSFGLTQRHCSIFSAVIDSPHREILFSGRFANGHCAMLSFLRAGKISSRILGTNPSFTFATKMNRLFS